MSFHAVRRGVVAVFALLMASGALAPRDIIAQSTPRGSRSGRPPSARSATGSTTSDKAESDDAKAEKGAKGAKGKSKGTLGRIIEFVIHFKIAIVVVLVGGLALSVGFLLLTGRASDDSVEDEDTIEILPIGGRRGDDDDGPRRVLIDPETGKPRDMPKRAESEYALVVDENVLHTHDTPSGELEATVVAVQGLLERQEYRKAYEKYRDRIEARPDRPFHPGLERRLAKYFIGRKDYRRAADILERHLESQPESEIEAESYFDLGYIHFKTRTLKKSRDCFEAFAERERNPAFSQRARKLIAEIDQRVS